MLKDKLDKLANKQKGEELCLLGIAMSKMSKEDLSSFVNVMQSDASATDIGSSQTGRYRRFRNVPSQGEAPSMFF